MTARVKIAMASAVAAAALAGLVRGGGEVRRRTVMASVEPASVMAVSTAGGVVAEVLAKPGDRVAKGAILVRFDAGALGEQRRSLESALESARTIAAIPRAAGAVAVDAHPDVLAAEERYTAALAAWEQSPGNGRAALDRATAERVEARRRVARGMGRSAAGIGETVATLEARLRDLEGALADREVRAPVDGVVEILDLRPGDRIAPGGPVAALTIPGEYVCEFRGEAGNGVVLRGALPNGSPLEAKVEGVVKRAVPVALREDRRVAEETFVRARFHSDGVLVPGSTVRLELP
jgi:multidrug resistance efflux pump